MGNVSAPTIGLVDDLRVGRALRAVRQRMGLRQSDVAKRAGVSQQLISLAERGLLEQLTLRSLRRIAQALEVRLAVEPGWRGGHLSRMLDAAHASLVDAVAANLRRHGWAVLVEYTFNHFGERGAVDLVGWHAEHRAVALVEVKSRITDEQDLHASMGRKRRIVPGLLARERGWQPVAIGEILVVADSRGNRDVVRKHAATFAIRLPARTVDARAWIRHPRAAINACWFLALTTRGSRNRDSGVRQRVRLPGGRSARPAEPAFNPQHAG